MDSLLGNIDIVSIDKEFFIEVREGLRDFTAFQEEIEMIWKKEQAERSIFNGDILCIKEMHQQFIRADFVSYKDYLAQVKDVELRKKFNILPISVSGITHSKGRFLLAKRSCQVTQYPNYKDIG